MRIEEALLQCRAVADCPGLVEALGGVPRLIQLSPSVFGAGRDASPITSAAEVGWVGPVPCVAVESSMAERAAVRLARRSMSRGEPLFAIAVTPSHGPIVLAIGNDPPSCLVLDPSAPDGVALSAL